jgi:hypothetical protein
VKVILEIVSLVRHTYPGAEFILKELKNRPCKNRTPFVGDAGHLFAGHSKSVESLWQTHSVQFLQVPQEYDNPLMLVHVFQPQNMPF